MGGKGKQSKGKGKGSNAYKGKFDLPTDGAIDVLQKGDITLCHTAATNPPQVKRIASFNFVSPGLATPPEALLVVPGLPKSLVNGGDARMPGKLRPDSEALLVDEMALQIPDYPTLPIFLSVREVQPEDYASIFARADIVCTNGDLRKLVGFLDGNCQDTSILVQKDGTRDHSFRTDIDVCADTCVLTRVEVQNVLAGDLIPKNTFGAAFEQVLTSPVSLTRESLSSYRVVNEVELGDLALIVCTEIDACNYGDQLPISQDDEWTPQECASTVKVCRAGALFGPQHGLLVELKTKSKTGIQKRGIDWKAYYLKMLFSGAEQLILGIHSDGDFGREELWPYSLKDVEEEAGGVSTVLGKLAGLLKQIIAVTKKDGNSSQLSLLCDGQGGPLQIRKRDGKARVPPSLVQFFEAETS
mmetsp:Transcript_102870/g.300131  ORF Transcript_102870/g.300131 Transcript_102870/m.300131 type:complete len:414 (-) Transcript_102870:167-1408(-)